MADGLRFLGHFKGHFLYAGLFSFFINLTLLVPPLYMIQVFDRVLSSRSEETLLMLTLLSLGMLLLMWALDYLRALLLLGSGALLDKLSGERVIASLVANASKVSRTETAHGLRDVAVLRGFLTGNSIIALFDAPWGVFFIALIFLFHPWMGWIALFGALVLFGLAWLNEKLNRQQLENIQVNSRRSSQFIDQGLRNADVVNGMGMLPGFVRHWRGLNQPVLEAMGSTGRRMGLVQSTSKFFRQIMQVAMMGAGAYLIIDQNLSPGIMIAATIIQGRAMAPVEMLLGNWANLVQARSAFARMAPLLAGSGESAPATRLPEPQGRLGVERVALAGKTPDRPILRHVALELGPGESLAVVGPSASGKSSLAKLIVGVWQPSAGAVRLDGADVSQVDREHFGRHVGYLPQDVELFPATVSENIARLGEIDSEAVIAAAQLAGVHDMVLRLPQGYDTPLGDGGHVLSGGQMQRIGIARALYRMPRLVVLDEPNANLDAEGEERLMHTLRALRLARVTLVLITHKPGLLADIDKVLVLRDGQMEQFGPRHEVLARILPPPPHPTPAPVAIN